MKVYLVIDKNRPDQERFVDSVWQEEDEAKLRTTVLNNDRKQHQYYAWVDEHELVVFL